VLERESELCSSGEWASSSHAILKRLGFPGADRAKL
jgi:hypothetical protein